MENEKRVTYEDIKRANDAIRTTDIKGKDYAEVNQRIKAFRMVYPEGTIATEMISNDNGVCIFKAMVYSQSDPTVNSLIGTGHAYEKEGSTFINKTSYIENCETSAVGRALGMAGFGIETSVASAEEVQNAINNQKKSEKPDPKWLAAINAECERTGLTREQIFKAVEIKDETQLSLKIFNTIMKKFEITPDKGASNE